MFPEVKESNTVKVMIWKSNVLRGSVGHVVVQTFGKDGFYASFWPNPDSNYMTSRAVPSRHIIHYHRDRDDEGREADVTFNINYLDPNVIKAAYWQFRTQYTMDHMGLQFSFEDLAKIAVRRLNPGLEPRENKLNNFFTIIAEGLNQLTNERFNVEELRRRCRDYLIRNPNGWARARLIQREGNEHYDSYLRWLGIADVAEEQRRMGGFPQRPLARIEHGIEAQIICALFNCNIHVIEITEANGVLTCVEKLINRAGVTRILPDAGVNTSLPNFIQVVSYNNQFFKIPEIEKLITGLPDNKLRKFRLGAVVNNADSTMEAVAQAINQFSETKYTVKSLREAYKRYLIQNRPQWIRNELAENYDYYLTWADHTDRERRRSDPSYAGNINDTYRIELRVLAQMFNCRIHFVEFEKINGNIQVIEKLASAEGIRDIRMNDVNYSQNDLIHLVRFENRMVPLLKTKKPMNAHDCLYSLWATVFTSPEVHNCCSFSYFLLKQGDIDRCLPERDQLPKYRQDENMAWAGVWAGVRFVAPMLGASAISFFFPPAAPAVVSALTITRAVAAAAPVATTLVGKQLLSAGVASAVRGVAVSALTKASVTSVPGMASAVSNQFFSMSTASSIPEVASASSGASVASGIASTIGSSGSDVLLGGKTVLSIFRDTYLCPDKFVDILNDAQLQANNRNANIQPRLAP